MRSPGPEAPAGREPREAMRDGPRSPEPIIRIRGLHKRFGDNHVLKGVDLDVEAGSTVVILGVSGSGKTVLMKHVIGLLRPDEGEIIVEGRDLGLLDTKGLQEARQSFGMVFQTAALFDSLTVYGNVSFPLREQFRKMPEAEIRRRVLEKLEMLGLAGHEAKSPAELSGGMRKRVGLARAVVMEPKILLYDEPTTGLDPITTDDVDNMILEARDALKVTSVVISHDIGSAFKVGTKIAVLYGGRIVAEGTPDVLKENPHPHVRKFVGTWLERRCPPSSELESMQPSFWTPLKVGLLTLAVIAALVVGITSVTGTTFREHESYLVYAIFDDVSGLRRRSRVQIAGIEVGQIEDIELVGHKAKVTLRIHRDIVLYTNARLSKRAEGLIGDMAIDIFPGSELHPVIAPGGEVRQVVSTGGIDQVFEILGAITADIHGVTTSLREVMGEETAEAIQEIVLDLSRLTETVNATILDSSEKIASILALFEGLTAEVHDVTVGERRTITSILHNVETVSVQMQEVLATIQGVIGSGEDELREGVADLRQTLERFNAALEDVAVIAGQVEEVTGKVARGEGTIGRLMLDDGLLREIEGTVSDASDFVERMMRLQTEVSLGTELHFRRGAGRTVAQVRLIPRENKWYSIGLVDPAAPTIEKVEVTEVIDGAATTTETWTATQAWQLHAYMARRWAFPTWSVTGRFGVFEGRGGIAGDLGLAGDRLSLSFEAFEFMSESKPYPRIRAFASWSFWNHLYVSGGVDDVLNPRTIAPAGGEGQEARDFFIGGGFFFTDEDLKAILTTVGVPTG